MIIPPADDRAHPHRSTDNLLASSTAQPHPAEVPSPTGIVRMADGSESGLLCSYCEGVCGLVICTSDRLPGTLFASRFEARILARG